jgi:uncharacterized membrane protein
LGFLLFLLAIGTCSAATVESEITRFTIVDRSVVVQSSIEFPGSITGRISWPVQTDAALVEVYIDGEKASAENQNGYINLQLSSAKNIKFSYISEDLIDKTNFLLNMPFDHDISSAKIILVLPEEATLKKPIKERAGSIYPLPDKASTDGRSLIFIWELDNITKGDDFSVFAMYKPKSDNTHSIYLLAAAVIALTAYILYTKKSPKKSKKTHKKTQKKSAEKPAKKEEQPQVKKDNELLEHLKGDEQQIVRVLKDREGSCEQGTLRIITGFSKAHLSRLLMELEARKVIFKEKRGKKNLVFLK